MTSNPLFSALAGTALFAFIMFAIKNNKTKIFLVILILLVYLGYKYYNKKSTESSWAPIYRDPKKEMLAMRGMANESNSVAGMIGNPVIGAMKHKNSLG